MNSSIFFKKYVLLRCFIVIGILQVSRLIFYVVNRDMFPTDKSEIIETLVKSVFFDVLSTYLYFIPFVCFVILLLFLSEIKKWQLTLLNIYYSLLFWFVSILSIADIFYYKFNLRRINLEAVDLIKDSYATILHFGIRNPLSIAVIVVIAIVFYYSFTRTRVNQYSFSNTFSRKKIFIASVLYLSFTILIFFRYAKYFSPLSSSLIVAPGYTGLYTNSPQSFIYSFRSGWTYVKPLNYFSDTEADRLVPVFFANDAGSEPNKRNIIIFILESFSYSYLDKNNKEKPSTPFFDSLINHSTFFTNAYANNTTSANGLCSILSGIPSLTNQAFFSSPYAANPVDAIGIALKNNGYQTSFFLGANDDHFGFKKGTRLLGIEHYYNGEAFPKSQQDGTWGVYDAPFLQYFAQKTNNIAEPFFNIFFTISSHYPFKIPDSLTHLFTSKNNYENERAVSYVDYSFRLFFDSIKNTQWFQNTIFIFTGDHVSKENKRERVKFNFNSYFHIPIFVFDPQNPEPRTISHLVQHIDIPATICQLTGITDTILSFGQPFYDSINYHYTINRYSENIIQMIDTNTLIQYDIINNKLLDVYNIKLNDELSLIKDPVMIEDVILKKIPILKAYMQQYFNRLYYNKMFKK